VPQGAATLLVLFTYSVSKQHLAKTFIPTKQRTPSVLVLSAGPRARCRSSGMRRRPSRAASGAVLQCGRWPAVSRPPTKFYDL
jgi:hypothetical protein